VIVEPDNSTSSQRLQRPLSARELQVLECIARGDTNKDIARRFGLSLHTVKRHVVNILCKLDSRNRGQAAARWRTQEHAGA
jgi:DNA-binding NarL/FixJ family response regulator